MEVEVKKRNKAAVMVTHDERMLEFCDKVYRMEDGVLTLEAYHYHASFIF